MPDITFTVDNKDYIAHLSKNHITVHGKDKKICTCIITSDNPMRAFSGVCVKNPNDDMKFDENYGFHLAFKRALFYQYVIEQLNNDLERKKSMKLCALSTQWFDYSKKFRVPFGIALHEYYEEDCEFPF